MGITARDLYFVLKVRDEATGGLQAMSRDILRVGAAAQAAGARSEAAALRQQAANMRAAGATTDETAGIVANAAALEQQAKSLELSARRHTQLAQAIRSTSQVLSLVGIAMIGVGVVGTAALLSTVNTAREYQRQVALTKTQVDGFSASLKQLSDIGKQVATDVAVPFNDVQSALYDIFSSTDANLQQATVMLNAFSRAAVAGQVSLQDSSRSTMQLMNAFKIPFQDVNKVLDLQFQLVRKGVGTYGQFATTIGRATPSAVRAGQSLQTLDAMLVFLTRNGLSAAMASASAARALDAFSNPKAVKALEQMNIKVKDTKGNFLPLVDILSQLSAKLGKLPQPQRVAALVDAFKGAGGTIQAMRFIQLAVKPDLFKDFQADLKAMNNSTGQFGNAYGLMAGTVESKTQLLKNNFNIVKESIGEILTPAFNKLLSFLTKILQAFNKLPESTRRTIINIVFFGSVLSIAAGIVLVVLGGIGALVAALAALGLSFGEVIAIMAGFTAVLAAIGAAAYLAWKKSKPLRDIFVSIGQELRAAWTNDIKPFIDSLVEGFDKRVKPALDELWQVINEKVLPILDELQKKYGKDFVKNLKEILNWLQKVADKGFTYVAWTIKHWLIPAIKDAIKFYEDHKKGIDKVLKVLEWLAKWIGKIAGSAILGALIAALILVIGAIVLLIEGTIALVDWIQKLIHWFSVAIDWVKSYFKWLFGLGDTTKKAKDAIVEAVKGIPGDIQNALAGAEQWLFNTGMKVIDGFISGMTSSLGKLGNFLSSVGNFIVQHKGPPSKDRQLLRNTGRLVMQGFGMGIKDMMPSLNAQLKDVTGKVVSVARGQVPRTTVLNRPVTSHKTVNNNITVNTHEMDPEAQAAKLGFLLAARTA